MYNGKNVKKSDEMRKCECNAKMRKNSHRIASLKNGEKTRKLIDRSLFRNRIRIALPALPATFNLLFLDNRQFTNPPITYYWTVPLILDHSYLVDKLTSLKIADTKVSGF
jgi:hypothetical protein